MESQMVLLLNTHGMTLTDPERDSISTTSFMTTSDNAYAVTEDSQSQAGSYVLGAVAVEDSSRFTVISAGSLIASEITDCLLYTSNIYNPVKQMELPGTMNQVVEDIIGNMNRILEKRSSEYGYQIADLANSQVTKHVQKDGLHPDQMCIRDRNTGDLRMF